jgi:hypothetical protein
MNWMTFVGPTFTLQMPTDWLAMASPQFQAMLAAPGFDGKVRPNLIIAMRQVQDDVTASAVADSTRATQEKEYPEYRVVSEQDYAAEDSQGVLRVYEWHDTAQDKRLRQVQVYFIAGRTLYTITATRALDSTQGEALDQVFNTMLQSFAAKPLQFD